MPGNLERLKTVGFVRAGHWGLSDASLELVLNAHASAQKVLYAFVVDEQVTYVGKTIQSLKNRMAGYRTPGPSQSTNIRNNTKIRKCLEQGKRVEIFVLPDNGLLNYGGFDIGLAAGLEDSVIRQLKPRWNGGKKETAAETLEPIEGHP